MKPTAQRRSKPPEAARRDRSDWAWGAAIVLLVALVYLPTLGNGYIWDDESYVEQNATLRSLSGLADIWFKLGAVPQYYPLVHTTFWIEYHLWGLHPAGYHAVNALLHAASAVLVWRLLVRLGVPGAWLAGALWAVHPVQVESVAWITERKNVLSCLLGLGSLWAYWRFAPPDSAEPGRLTPQNRGWYALALVLYVAALWSKTVTVSVPAVILVVRWWKRGRLAARDVALLLPMFALGLTLAGITVWMERTHVGASGDEWNFSPLDRLLIAGRALWFYAGKLSWPHPLIFFYPRWTIDDRAAWQYLFPAAALAVIVLLWLLRGRWGRGPLAAVLIFAGVLVPALGFFNVYPFRYSFVADHFQYHASIALVAWAASGLTLAARRWLAPYPRVAQALAGGLLLVLAALAARQTLVYRNAQSVYEAVVALNPKSWAAQHNLGNALHDQGHYAEAIAHYEASLAVEPNPDASAVHASWGSSLLELGQRDEAEAHFRKSIELARPGEAWRGQIGLGGCLQDAQQYAAAAELYEQALETLPPQFAWPTRVNLALCYSALGEADEAVEQLRKALALRPRDVDTLQRLGVLLLEQGQTQQAIAPLSAAVKQRPDVAALRVALARALLATGQLQAAQAHARDAVRLEPLSAEAHNLLGAALAQLNDLAAAAKEFETALAIDPRHRGARENLERTRALQPGNGKQ